ncbi:DUF4238 domain-containing protein [Bradyrhizobium sp. 23]|uniref:DUF4238 domain-containing protein n=1 Tax=Bradyrhizobium sp. 23 TaxID=2782667 RepID=UPI001FF7134D|nr:DUF4238 domain-containing protein [Bradyrhizobium sp. 23]MCK1317359.1 DUF4238 domain-containing protein [Bradyrhizobium sp. 23]
MTATRNNHYVPRWYQAGFFEPGQTTLAYLDLTPPPITLPDGRVKFGNSLIHWPTARCFQQLDLYSTFFGTLVNDEIERHMFGDVDTKGAKAIRAFAQTDISEWHRQFQNLFLYIDAQKIRTPKGLDWLRAQYPALTQNELMGEMQGIRSMHCTFWAEGVREIISAEDSDVKFIISDHPVTIYNHALPPDSAACSYPLDPSIALKASQTLFPLSRDFCMIFTNFEYAQDPATNPLEKRTFARNYRSSMVQTHAFIRERKLSAPDVARVNRIMRARAKRYVAAGRKEWLHPNQGDDWDDLRHILLPPKKELYRYGGEMFAKFEDGSVHYQDAFGRTEKQHEILQKAAVAKPLRSKDLCGCGNGRNFGECCEGKPVELRPSWTERSIRERNLMFLNALDNVLGLADENRGWNTVRRELTDQKIKLIYQLFGDLWPEDTDLLRMLPKPDGKPRAVYTGLIHPDAIGDYALGASLYFGELIIQHPFMTPRIMSPKYSPITNPSSHRQEVLKSILLFLKIIPLVERGLVHLVPDPCDFDSHLRNQMWEMARARSAGIDPRLYEDERTSALMRGDTQRSIMSMPPAAVRWTLSKAYPAKSEEELDVAVRLMLEYQHHDPLAVLQDPADSGENDGRLNAMKLQPNFEMALYLAQATGASIITDSPARWHEIRLAVQRPARARQIVLPELTRSIGTHAFGFPQFHADIFPPASDKIFTGYPAVMRDTFKYLSKLEERGAKPNVEQNLAGRFTRTHEGAQAVLEKKQVKVKTATVLSMFPKGGIQDNTVNRLLLMSSSEHHLPNVPMAFFIRPPVTNRVRAAPDKPIIALERSP